MLRAVGVPGLDPEQDRLVGRGPSASGIGWRQQALDERGIVVDHLGRAPQLDATAVGVVDQEQEGAAIVLQIAQRDVLPVAAQIGKAQRPLVQHLQETFRAAAVLDVGLALAIGRRHEDAGLSGDEGGEIRRHGRLPATALLHAAVAGARAALLLDRLDGRGEGDVAGGAARTDGAAVRWHSVKRRGVGHGDLLRAQDLTGTDDHRAGARRANGTAARSRQSAHR